MRLINKDNAKNLSVAWTFLADEVQDIQANPVVADGVIYTPISGGYIAAINGSNGKLIWKSTHYGKFAARRGLIYWPGKGNNSSRIIFSNRKKLISLNAKDGKEIKTFGNKGKTRSGLNVMTPVIYKGNIIIASWDHAIEAYDLMSGKIKWKIKFKKKIYERNGGIKYNNKGANPWSGISLDKERGLLFITTGNPHAYFDGTQRPGQNRYSNSIIAIDLNNKKILWDFQETSHDIWNHDISGIPILTKIKKNGHYIDVVVTPTKLANTIILDRLTGLPIFDFRLRKAPSSKTPGEKILLKAIQAPFYTVLDNAGIDLLKGYEDHEGYGIDCITGERATMISAGIIDPVLVTKSALKNAVSVVSTIISADCVISNMRTNESN